MEEVCVWGTGPFLWLPEQQSNYSADSVIKYANLAMTDNADNATCKFANTGITGTSSYMGILRGNMGNHQAMHLSPT
jgi:hypothetical protein